MKYNLIATDETQNITVVYDGEMYVANGEHPMWKEIVAAAVADDPNIVHLFDQTKRIAEKFERLSERVLVANGRVYFDGDETDNAVTEHILRIVEDPTASVKPVVMFLEKLMQNDNLHSRDQLYRWLNANQFTLNDDGDILGYKGVQMRDGVAHSISSGSAIVNGELKNGNIPNPDGAIVEMPRSEVQFDPGVGCSTGLHVGTYRYASDFGHGHLLQVHVNPRDVVSVPTDCNDQKMRTCRYTVIKEIAAEVTSPVWSDSVDDDDEDLEDDYYNDWDEEEEDPDEDDAEDEVVADPTQPIFPGLDSPVDNSNDPLVVGRHALQYPTVNRPASNYGY